MRRILSNYGRDRHCEKRGGIAVQVSLSEVALDERKSQVVELRYFGGLEIDGTAAVLKVSPITVMRDWKFARAWLSREIEND